MTKEEVMRIAKEAGAKPSNDPQLWDIWNTRDVNFERFAKLVAAYEREECAKVCEEQMKAYMSSQYTTDPLGGFRERFAAEKCADAIRAKGQK